MLRQARQIALFVAIALSTTGVYANNFSYNAVDINLGMGPTTFGGGFSTQFMDSAHFVFKADSKFHGDYDIAAGLGFNGPVGQFFDLSGQMLIHNIKTDSGKFIGEDVLPEINFGGRLWFFDGIELHGKLGQLLDGDDSSAIWEVGGRFHSTQQLVLGASLLDNGVYGNQLRVQARFQY